MFTYIRQAWLVLLLGLVFGLALAGVNSSLAPIIAQNERDARQRAALEVIPGGVRAEQVEFTLSDATTTTVFRVLGDKDVHLGWAVPARGQGYGDTIKLIVGLKPKPGTLVITDFQVIYNQETPGLGNKIVGEGFRRRFRNKAGSIPLQAVNREIPVLDEVQGVTGATSEPQIQALTGATISSQAVCDIIYKQLNETGLLAKLIAYKPVQTTTTKED